MRPKDFTIKMEELTRKKRGKRVYLNDIESKDLIKKLNEFIEPEVEVPKIRVGEKRLLKLDRQRERTLRYLKSSSPLPSLNRFIQQKLGLLQILFG